MFQQNLLKYQDLYMGQYRNNTCIMFECEFMCIYYINNNNDNNKNYYYYYMNKNNSNTQ